MDVEFDPAKDLKNRRKHKISLQRAEDFDLNTAAIEPDTRESYGEERFNALGFIDARLYSLTFAVRGSAIRVISLREANRRERRNYEEAY